MKQLRQNRGKDVFLLLTLFCVLWLSAVKPVKAEKPTVPDPQTGNAIIVVSGEYEAVQPDVLLARMNEIRMEAKNEGLVNTYVPLAWSDGLEEIARLRAPETAILMGHSRPNGSRHPFMVASNGMRNNAENLAWSSQGGSMRAVEQFYEEKADYLLHRQGKTANGPTGHFATLINPEYVSVGAAAFYSPITECYQSVFVFSVEKEQQPLTLPAYSEKAYVEVEGGRMANLSLSLPEKATANTAADWSATAEVRREDIFSPSGISYTNVPVVAGLHWSIAPKEGARIDGNRILFASGGRVYVEAAIGNTKASAIVDVADSSSNEEPTPDEENKIAVDRFSGANREEVAATVARTYFAKADTVLIVNNMAYGDAMSATNLSRGEMPILYTRRDDLPDATRLCLLDLAPENIIVLGGTGSVSKTVENALRRVLPQASFRRLDGPDRFAVNAKTLTNPVGGTIAVNGLVFADALMASPLAQVKGAQIALIRPNEVPSAVEEKLDSANDGAPIHIVGGTGSVSPHVQQYFAQRYDTTVDRIAAPDRYRLSSMVATQFPQGKRAILVSGEKFSDALVAAPLAQQWNAPIFLTRAAALDTTVRESLSRFSLIRLLGGPASIAESVVEKLTGKAY